MENWKDMKGFEGFYQISNMGNIKSLPKSVRFFHYRAKKECVRITKEKLLKPGLTRKGYLLVVLYNGIESKSYSVHRLVAKTFIPNPENKPDINHIDANPKNNKLSNLEWVTKSENQLHSYRVIGRSQPMGACKRIKQFTETGIEIKEFSSAREASRETGAHWTKISACLHNQRNTAGGYIWRFSQ